jgi:4-alpha-glucanotransferase
MSCATPPPPGDDPTAPRRAGVLLPLGSLPDGRLGPGAFAFVDWLADAGQAWWQVLPITPPDRYGSPYASPSAFAGWPGYLAAPRARVSAAQVSEFRERNGYWIDDWARAAGPGALEDQVRVDREWRSLRDHAASRAVRILGDLPFYVAPRGADVRAHPGLFRSDSIAGVPPDAFTADGQLWGNPTYDWAAMRAEGYRWWTERLRRSRELFDSLRIDHFRAFVAWWGVPRGARTARSGSWRRGPGADVIDAARAQLGALSLVAEDLGVITPPVRALMARLGLPGMRVIQFAFEGSPGNPHRLENHVRHAVVYSGTHDNQTAAGWWDTAPEVTRKEAIAAAAAAGIAGEPPHRTIVRLALSSPAGLAIVPVQDLLGLGDDARLNTPGTRHGNWAWRLGDGRLTAGHAAWLREATEAAGRLSGPTPPPQPDPVPAPSI